MLKAPHRKIIHVDMDCFYAAIEIRDNPQLVDKPVAVGAKPEQRGVICTCNYRARAYGVRSAMPTATAYRHCKDLVVLPVNMPKYRQVAKSIHAIFQEFTDLVEPLALDEAYLDVTNSIHHQGSATLIAQAIRERIFKKEALTASAGVASNKFLAKIASGWKKPNGLFVIQPHEVENFIKTLPVTELFGVGKVTANKMQKLEVKTCADLQQWSLTKLIEQFGKLGQHLYEQSRGYDHRPVQPNRVRKSLSVETTFEKDISDHAICLHAIKNLYDQLIQRLQRSASDRLIKNQYLKIKFSNFKLATAEIACNEINLERYMDLFQNLYSKKQQSIRLLGLGLHFQNNQLSAQQTLF